jgi:hypothetical protein
MKLIGFEPTIIITLTWLKHLNKKFLIKYQSSSAQKYLNSNSIFQKPIYSKSTTNYFIQCQKKWEDSGNHANYLFARNREVK